MGRHLKKEQINQSLVGRKMRRKGEGRRGEKSWLEGREEIKGKMRRKVGVKNSNLILFLHSGQDSSVQRR